MEDNGKNWPIVVGITAGVVGGIVAAVYVYAARMQNRPEMRLRDAHDIIAQCRDKIKEIEESLDALKQPVVA